MNETKPAQPVAAQPATIEEAAALSNAWPFEEARKVIARLEKRPKSGPVIFETGYGPSGLPHLGTFGEVARTTMVRNAFRMLTGDKIATKLIAFSDDMDGLRKVPDNVPNQAMMASHLGRSLSSVPDPFSNEYPSFGAHNNARLRAFLDAFGFDYEFLSATDCYREGRFDAALMVALERFDQIMAVMLPTLREERRASYSPFLPIHPVTGIVMQVPILERNAGAGTIVWADPDTGERYETRVTGGAAKLQWKPDWAMRWTALGVDYEMSGKDLIDSVKASGQICRVLGGTPPEGFTYELFLDEKGQKISKSKGNGLSIEEWLAYANPESLSLFMYQQPKTAKRLHFDIIPKTVDEYLAFRDRYPAQTPREQVINPVWHIHAGKPPAVKLPLSFSMLMNIASASNTDDKAVLWGFLGRYAPGVTPVSDPALDEMVGYAVRYFNDHIKPNKRFKTPDAEERVALEALSDALAGLPEGADAETIQATLYDVGRLIPKFQDPKAKGATPERPGVSGEWFSTLYKLLIGQEKGPRFGTFIAVYGIAETRALIGRALDGTID